MEEFLYWLQEIDHHLSEAQHIGIRLPSELRGDSLLEHLVNRFDSGLDDLRSGLDRLIQEVENV